MHIIEVNNLVKTFKVAKRRRGIIGACAGLFRRQHKIVRALDDVSFNVEPGELLGYIGPNGAGKSSTVKILSGILVPDSGEVKILGNTPWLRRIETVRRIGVVFGQRTQLWWDLPVIESLELLRDIYSVPQSSYKAKLDELTGELNLESLLDTPVRQLSLGQRVRCDLAAALLHSPEILFLDEPTIGLDAVNKLALRNFLQKLNADGLTVILTTHDMDDIEVLCNRVIVINNGGIFMDGTLEQLRAKVSSERRLIVDLAGSNGKIDIPHVNIINRDSGRLTLGFDPNKIEAAKLIATIAAQWEIRDLFLENPPIDEIIARLYGADNHGQ